MFGWANFLDLSDWLTKQSRLNPAPLNFLRERNFAGNSAVF